MEWLASSLGYLPRKFEIIIIKMEVENKSNLIDEADKKQDDSRLDSLNAFYVLFAISFGPAFIAIDLSTDSTDQKWVTCITLAVIFIVFLMNFVSIFMLTSVHTYTKLGSY